MLQNKKLWIKEILWAVVFAGIVAAILRFSMGLGATTGLNDATPWGLWIGFKLGFVALAGGGFTLAAIVHIFHLEFFHPILRRAILLAMLGYGSFIVSLIFDLGLPWHIYMPIINWQHHSVMFEIAWCVLLYFSVLIMEFAPVALEHPWLQHKWLQFIYRILKKATIPLVIAGIVLSTLHQSSLGSLFLIAPHRVHPLWYSSLIPVFFFTSAIATGLLALILESNLVQRWYGRGLQFDILTRLGEFAAYVLWFYLALRLGDLIWRGVIPTAIDGSWQSLLFMAEILIGGILPAILLSIPQIRNKPEGLITSAILGVAGILTQRLALSTLTVFRPDMAPYRPSFLEVVIAFAIPAAAGLIYLFFIENLKVVDEPLDPIIKPGTQHPSFDPLTRVYKGNGLRSAFVKRSGIAIFIMAATLAFIPGRIFKGEQMPPTSVSPATGWQTLQIDGNQSGYAVSFPHQEHQERLTQAMGDEALACATCHHMDKPEDQASACSECHQDYYLPSSIFNHSFHVANLGGNQACTECHGGNNFAAHLLVLSVLNGNSECLQCHTGEHLPSNAATCEQCHEQMQSSSTQTSFSYQAIPYQEAIHQTCINCHQRQAFETGQPTLGECGTCHTGTLPDQILETALSN